MSKRKGRGRGGFSLVEIMVAMLLLAITVTSLTAYTGFVANARLAAKARSLGSIAAQEAIDAVRSQSFDSIAVGTTYVESTVGRLPLTVTTAITLAKPAMKLVTVTVSITGGQEVQSFITAIFKAKV
jgi:prepilin-type N-terminal cleavage/methylation domain-containing protein